jgi:uncharacterized protein YuzE
MKLYYDGESDSLYIELSSAPGADAREIAPGVVADLDNQGNLVGLDIEHASKKMDLRRLEVESFPLTLAKPA